MKSTPAMTKAREQMLPGIITRDGFLGDDLRPLPDIIESDEGLMASVGLRWDEVVRKLRGIIEMSREASYDGAVHLGKDLDITVEETRGRLPCPFGDGFHYKDFIVITHKSTGKKVQLSELSLHLIEAHHFLQGKGSAFRMEPSILKVIIENVMV
jgi:hypothetical protein